MDKYFIRNECVCGATIRNTEVTAESFDEACALPSVTSIEGYGDADDDTSIVVLGGGSCEDCKAELAEAHDREDAAADDDNGPSEVLLIDDSTPDAVVDEVQPDGIVSASWEQPGTAVTTMPDTEDKRLEKEWQEGQAVAYASAAD